uniref:Uncharacterized protein n=1 Tax=Molossus molossus TaxID=27622 RepID=A0A7J8CW66_MOLMO|nr:hypothetical protein HJG59_001739 [Molossus molossus]
MVYTLLKLSVFHFVFVTTTICGSWRYRKGRLDSGLFSHLRARTEIPQQEKLGRGRAFPPAGDWA